MMEEILILPKNSDHGRGVREIRWYV